MRLQHVQNNVKNDDKERQDIEHIRRLMSENQLALTSLVTTLGAIQEEVRTVRVLFSKQQANTFQIAAPGTATAAAGRSVSIVKPKQQQQQQQQQQALNPPESAPGKDAKSPQVKRLVRMNSRL